VHFQVTNLPHPYRTNCGMPKLRFFDSYSKSKCFLDKLTRYVVKQCQCRDWFMPGKFFLYTVRSLTFFYFCFSFFSCHIYRVTSNNDKIITGLQLETITLFCDFCNTGVLGRTEKKYPYSVGRYVSCSFDVFGDRKSCQHF